MSQKEIALVGRNNNKAVVTGQGALLIQHGDKMSRIVNSPDYTRTFTYYGSTSNCITIVYTGTTEYGAETLTETITYVDPSIDGSNVTQIVMS